MARWHATDGGAVVGLRWARSLGSAALLTMAGDAAAVRLWRLDDVAPALETDAAAATGSGAGASGPAVGCAALLAVAASPHKDRLLVAEVLRPVGSEGSALCGAVLLAGDQHGALMAFWLPPELAAAATRRPAPCGVHAVADAPLPRRLAPVLLLRGELGPAPVTSLRCTAASRGVGSFVAVGRDGVLARYRCHLAPTAAESDSAAQVGSAGAELEASDSGGSGALRLECLERRSRLGVPSPEVVVDLPTLGQPPIQSLPPQALDASGATRPSAAPMGPAVGPASTTGPVGSGLGGAAQGSSHQAGPVAGVLVGGYHGPDFLLAQLSPDPLDVLRVAGSGGWRRPHALAAWPVARAAGGGPGGFGFAFAHVGDAPGHGEGGPVAAGVHVMVRRSASRTRVPGAAARLSAGTQALADPAAAASAGRSGSLAGVLGPLPSSLQPAHHGRELLCCVALRPPGPAGRPGEARAHPLVLVSGSEDGSLRRVTAVPAASAAYAGGGLGASAHYAPVFQVRGTESGSCCAWRAAPRAANTPAAAEQVVCGPHGPQDATLVGEHAAGTAVRCLAACALPPHLAAQLAMHGPGHDVQAGPDADGGPLTSDSSVQLLVSAGAKEVLMAWLLQLTAPGPFPTGQPPASRAAAAIEDEPPGAAMPTPAVSSRWLSTLPPRQGLRPRAVHAGELLGGSGDR